MLGLPSLRFGKLRLYELTITLISPSAMSIAGPLPDARTAGVRQHDGADGFEVGQQAVALDGGRTCSEPGVTSSRVLR